MGVGMSLDKPQVWMRQALALRVLLEYGPADADRPPVTAALLAANALAHLLRPDALLPWLVQVAFNPHRIIQDGDLRRLFLSAFYHANEIHFFANMMSLLRTGIELETSMGSVEFGFMAASLLGLSQGITLLLCKGLLFLGNDWAYYHQYSVGFSGVMFGMTVVRNAWADDVELPGVLRIRAKHVVWVQLFLVQAIIPQSCFIGHVGGILAGLTYLGICRGDAGPIALLTWGVADAASRSVRFARRLLSSAARLGHHVSPALRETGRGMWRCYTCCNDNSRCADICETCSTPHKDRAFSRRRQL